MLTFCFINFQGESSRHADVIHSVFGGDLVKVVWHYGEIQEGAACGNVLD